jgi:hypothetical protein
MQGVAAKNDASYDLSRARASVTGQTTIAASTAATPMTPPPSEKSGLAKDLIVILGAATGFGTGSRTKASAKTTHIPWPSPRTARSWSSPAAARGVTLPRPMIASPCTISLGTPPPISAVICAMRPEQRRRARTSSETSSSPQQMDTRGIEQTGFSECRRNWTLSCRDRFAHRASWRGALASSVGRAI